MPITSSPNGALGGLPVYPIPAKAPLSSASAAPLGFPDSQTIELTNPATLQVLTSAPSRFSVTNTSGAPAFATFTITVRFLDLSTGAEVDE